MVLQGFDIPENTKYDQDRQTFTDTKVIPN